MTLHSSLAKDLDAIAAGNRLWGRCEPVGECWVWRGCVTSRGYGSIYFQGKMVSAHRLAAMLSLGELPAEKMVCHTCDVRACCNPAHLFVGSQADNMTDMSRKGRAPRRGVVALSVNCLAMAGLQEAA